MTTTPENDPLKSIWRAQALESSPMPLERIQARLRADRLKSRQAFMIAMAGAAAGLFIAGLQWRIIDSLTWRMGVGLTALGYLVFLMLAYRRTQQNQQTVPGEACAAFLHDILRRRLRQARWGGLLLIAPLGPGLAVSLTAMALHNSGPAANFAPIAAVGGLWLAAMLIIQHRKTRHLRQELIALERMIET